MKRKPTRKLNFTRRALESLQVPRDGTRLTVFDEHTAGLGLVVFPSGIRSFFHLRFVRGYPRRTTIGRFEDLSIDQVRGKASELNTKLAKWKLADYHGETPFEGKRDPALDYLMDQYVEKHVKAQAARPELAAKRVEWEIKKYLASWRKRRADSIRKADVIELHDCIGRESGKISANRIVQLLRRIFNWAQEAELWRGENPAEGIKLFPESKRTRFLAPHELPKFFKTLRGETNSDLRDFVNLAMWTGARRGDIFSMRWENVGLDDNRWQIPDPKNRTPYTVVLTPEAVAILRNRQRRANGNEWVFPSCGRTGHLVDLKGAWKRLLTRAGLADKDLRQHDLRRTLGSYQAAQGASLSIIGKSLGHKSLAATQIYAQLDLDPIRASVLRATRAMIRASKKKPKLLKAGRA